MIYSPLWPHLKLDGNSRNHAVQRSILNRKRVEVGPSVMV